MDDDDDFGDFGGFEAAEPVAPQEAQQASPSPWALFPGTQPDVIQSPVQDPQQASAIVPNHSDSQLSTNSPLTGASNGQTQNKTSTAAKFDVNFDTDFDLEEPKQSSVSSGPLPDKIDNSAFGVASAGKFDNGSSTGISANGLELDITKDAGSISSANLPSSESGISLGLDTPEESSVTTTEVFQVEESSVANFSDTCHPQPATSVCSSGQENQNVAQKKVIAVQEEKMAELTEKLSLAEREKAHIQKVDRVEIQELTERNTELEQELQIQKERLDDQIRKYDSVQAQHSEVLQDLRTAGHNALSIIVEEYKEVVKVALLQQQESCEKALQEALILEADRCEQLMIKQQDRFAGELEDMKKALNQKAQEALEEQSKKYQASLEVALKEEQAKCYKTFESTLEDEKTIFQKTLEEAISAEREKATRMLQEERESLKGVMAEEKTQVAQAIKAAVEEEHSRAEEVRKDSIKTERQSGDERLKEAMKVARKEMKLYVEEQRQADKTLRRKALMTIDLFLEGARKQLDFLMSEGTDQIQDTDS